jgi:hypothetical protein
MLRPLRAGTYELNFGGRLPNMSQAVTYTLIVERRSGFRLAARVAVAATMAGK